MKAYYQARAREYEAVYAKPERQRDLAQLRHWLAQRARGRTILELACGTGYWTAIAAATARYILATDLNPRPLALARAKTPGANVAFCRADAYALPLFDRRFDCGMAHFWWSHVPLNKIGAFVAHFCSRLSPGASLLMIDNRFVPGSSTPLSRRDADGNTYRTRTLSSGAQHEVIKNFPTPREIDCAPRRLAAVSSGLAAASRRAADFCRRRSLCRPRLAARVSPLTCRRPCVSHCTRREPLLLRAATLYPLGALR
jgi:SAM-dependent methyltransferase